LHVNIERKYRYNLCILFDSMEGAADNPIEIPDEEVGNISDAPSNNTDYDGDDIYDREDAELDRLQQHAMTSGPNTPPPAAWLGGRYSYDLYNRELMPTATSAAHFQRMETEPGFIESVRQRRERHGNAIAGVRQTMSDVRRAQAAFANAPQNADDGVIDDLEAAVGAAENAYRARRVAAIGELQQVHAEHRQALDRANELRAESARSVTSRKRGRLEIDRDGAA